MRAISIETVRRSTENKTVPGSKLSLPKSDPVQLHEGDYVHNDHVHEAEELVTVEKIFIIYEGCILLLVVIGMAIGVWRVHKGI